MSTLTPAVVEAPVNQEDKHAFARLDNPLNNVELVRFDRVLNELQGNVLKPHGRNYANHVFLSFRPGLEIEVKNWLKRTAARLISAKQQLEPSESAAVARQNNQLRAPFLSLLLSAKGYRYLGFDPSAFEKQFVEGMEVAATRLNDDRSKWEDPYRKDLHALCVLGDDNKERLDLQTEDLIKESGEMTSSRPLVERGLWKWRPGLQESDRVEHFGYRDGRSNPIFFMNELESQGKGTFTKWNSGAGPGLVCAPDPLGNEFGCGTYFVFQKLEQDVKGFFEAKRKLASDLGVDPSLAGAFMVGRFEAGEPLVLTGKPNPSPEKVAPNDFDYTSMDPMGLKCPVFSHIRKVNPRGTSTDIDPTTNEKETLQRERTHRIARRGIPYGQRDDATDDPTKLPSVGVGLLFVCCQSSIENQFEVMQARWANRSYFPQLGTGMDPLIGQPSKPEPGKDPELTAQLWPTKYGGSPAKRRSVSGLVRIKGGEYFFAPSKSFFNSLKS
jgi:deferrochelatase/peroxidase EfeB